ncbi:MAG: family 78 glycoside hydrolase catalytic domain, partial [Clostridia bacterium]|nr:family 78 glycoside hydrolase catalytic domain [Clostridia bacterium]
HILSYDTYDLLPCLRPGRNAVCLLLGNGICNCVGGQVWDYDRAPWRAAPSVALSACVEQADGETVRFTAADFLTAPSAILFDDMRAGEWYDARREQAGWLLPDFDDAGWTPAVPAPAPRGKPAPADLDPILPAGELEPVSRHRGGISIFPALPESMPDLPWGEGEEGEGWIYDFGLNISGVVRLTVRNSRPGQKIVLQYGEILGDNPAGGADTTVRRSDSGLDLRGFHFLPHRYNHRDVYICRGDDEEVWEPTFTIHGFQYCLVLGAEPEQISLRAVILHTALNQRAWFRCSDETANRIWEATLRTDRTNFCHYPTDCPHREKNFWLGDAMISAEQMTALFSCERNLTEWLRGFRPAMREDGALPGIVPTFDWGYHTWGPAWDGALIELPYQIWIYRGELTAARENASAILRSLRYLAALRNGRGLVDFGGGGDWCQAARGHVSMPKAPRVFTSTVITMDLFRKAARLFEALVQEDEAMYARRIGGELRAAARRYLLNLDEARAIYRCQTAQAMALYYGLFEPGEAGAAFEVLLRLIEENGGSFDCGIHGLRVIFHVLSRFGRSDLAFRMITKPDFPSYGYWIAHGANTLWELFSPIERVQSSCNHHFTGDVANWFLRNLAGIRLNPFGEDPREVHIAPSFIAALNHASGSLETAAGPVRVAWRRDGEDILLEVSIPEGVAAELRLESGWQTEEGFTALPLAGETRLRILPVSKPDILRRFARAEL